MLCDNVVTTKTFKMCEKDFFIYRIFSVEYYNLPERYQPAKVFAQLAYLSFNS